MIYFKLEKGYPCKCGATPVNDGVLFSFESDSDNCGIILKNKKSKKIKKKKRKKMKKKKKRKKQIKKIK